MNRRQILKSLTIAGALAAIPMITLPAQALPNWLPAGSRVVNGLVDVDRINVGPIHNKADKIRLKVRGNSLMIYDLKIRYTNGSVQDVPVRLLIPQGGTTRIIDLAGTNRNIKNITFTYGKFPNGKGKTYVDLWVRK